LSVVPILGMLYNLVVLYKVGMHVISKRKLKEYWERHANAQGALQAWLEKAERVVWGTPADVQRDYGDDVILPNSRAVFNIKGNTYRLVVHINYGSHTVFIRFIGTHAEYDKIDATRI